MANDNEELIKQVAQAIAEIRGMTGQDDWNFHIGAARAAIEAIQKTRMDCGICGLFCYPELETKKVLHDLDR